MLCPTLKELPPPPLGKQGWPWTEETPQLPDTMPDVYPVESLPNGIRSPFHRGESNSTGALCSLPDGRAWPKISIVTPSYNQGQFLGETIRSVLLQSYPNLEYVLIGGGCLQINVYQQ